MNIRHFRTLNDLSSEQLKHLIVRSCELKQMIKTNRNHLPLRQRTLAMIFEKSSTRTRVSFETAMTQLGGNAIFLSPRDTQLGRGESVADTAKVLSSMVDATMIRTFEQHKVESFAKHSKTPVINGLTDSFHPCQLLADLQTIYEHFKTLDNIKIAWIGDGNNMCHSYINAARLLNFNLSIACPDQYPPDTSILGPKNNNIHLTNQPFDAVENANVIVTDVWASMGQEDESKERNFAFNGFQVNKKLMAHAQNDAIFLHCLPAHRNEEVSAEVIDGPQSLVWQEAENRLHSQKALLEWLIQN